VGLVAHVNGLQVAPKASMTMNPARLGTTTSNWIGHSHFAADPDLNGLVDNFRIYSCGLSPAVVRQIFQSRQ
jgi:uncharacterized protein